MSTHCSFPRLPCCSCALRLTGARNRRNPVTGEVVYPSGNVVPTAQVHYIGADPPQGQVPQWIPGMVPQSPVDLVPRNDDE